MLHCVYHPLDDMRVVECAEREALLASGLWFDCPAKARNFKQELASRPPRKKPGRKPKGEDHEKRSNEQ